jgi:hypothetical protein
MVLQRLGGGIAWLALVAASLFLLWPQLFPDIALPAAVAGVLGGEGQRRLIGMAVGLLAAAIGLGGLAQTIRGGAPRSSVTFAGPMLGAEPVRRREPPVVVPAAPPAPALKLVETEAPSSSAPVPTPLGIVVTPGHKAMLEALRAGDAARDQGHAEIAAEHYAAAVEIARRLYAAAPDDFVAKADLAIALPRLAVQEEALDRIESALGLLEETVELRRSLAAAAPEDAPSAEALAKALTELADCRQARGHASRARDHYAEAVGISERLSSLEPESEPRRAVLAAHKARRDALQAELGSNDP